MTILTLGCVEDNLNTIRKQVKYMDKAIDGLVLAKMELIGVSSNLYSEKEVENQEECIGSIIDRVRDTRDMMRAKYEKIAEDAILAAGRGPNALAMYCDPCEIACKYCTKYIDSYTDEDEYGHGVMKVLCGLNECDDEFITAPIGCKGFDVAVKQPSDCDRCVRKKGCWAFDQHPTKCTSYEEVSQ